MTARHPSPGGTLRVGKGRKENGERGEKGEESIEGVCVMCMWLIDVFKDTKMCGLFLGFTLHGAGEGG